MIRSFKIVSSVHGFILNIYIGAKYTPSGSKRRLEFLNEHQVSAVEPLGFFLDYFAIMHHPQRAKSLNVSNRKLQLCS